MADKYQWLPETLLPDEHRIFPLKGKQWTHIAIADKSGRTPDVTDDGVLWLDFDWNLMITSPDEVCSIPVKRSDDDADERFSVITNPSTLLLLSQMFDWPIEDQVEAVLYRVYKTNPRRPVQAMSKEKK
jgi:hypothetical protein